jgi:CHRD domain
MPGVRAVLSVLTATAVSLAGLWAAIALAGGHIDEASGVSLRAALDARGEVPKPKGVPATARGTFVATLVRKGSGGGTVAWRLTFRGLSGAATAAHVHLGVRGRSGPVAVPLCGPCRSGARGTARTNARAVRALLTDGAYVNLHTAKNPAGEIRGQIRAGSTAAPPPATTTTTTTSTTTTDTGYEPYP